MGVWGKLGVPGGLGVLRGGLEVLDGVRGSLARWRVPEGQGSQGGGGALGGVEGSREVGGVLDGVRSPGGLRILEGFGGPEGF